MSLDHCNRCLRQRILFYSLFSSFGIDLLQNNSRVGRRGASPSAIPSTNDFMLPPVVKFPEICDLFSAPFGVLGGLLKTIRANYSLFSN